MWIVVNLAAVASLGVPSLLHWQVVVHHRAESSSSFIFEFLIDISVHARGACCRLCCCWLAAYVRIWICERVMICSLRDVPCMRI